MALSQNQLEQHELSQNPHVMTLMRFDGCTSISCQVAVKSALPVMVLGFFFLRLDKLFDKNNKTEVSVSPSIFVLYVYELQLLTF